MRKRTIVFERLNNSSWFTVAWYALRKWRIAYLHADVGEPAPAWFSRHERAGRLRAVRLREPLYLRLNPAADRAFETIEPLYESAFTAHPLIARMARLFGDRRIELAFKKYLTALLEQHFHYHLLGERLVASLPDAGTLYFVPALASGGALFPVTGGNLPPFNLPFLRGRAIADILPELPVRAPWWFQWRGRCREFVDNLKVCAETILFSLWTCAAGARRHRARLRYPFAVASIVPAREFANAIRGCDMLLDGTRIRTDNTLIVPIAGLSSAQRASLKVKGLAVAEYPSRPSWPIAATVLRHEAAVLWNLARSPWWISRVAAYAVRDYGLWMSFIERYDISQFVSYNELSFRPVVRNLLFKRCGVETWYYADTVNTADVYLVNGEQAGYRQSIWGYLLYDHCVTWNASLSSYHRRHHQAIGEYLDVGCLWSEHVRLFQEEVVQSTLRERLPLSGNGVKRQILAVFDSSYHPDSITNYEDGIAFARGIGQLLEVYPDIVIVWKEKKSRNALQALGGDAHRLARVYEELSRHPRCVFVGAEACPSEVLALCDLAITFPFTSIAVEALGAGVKALYYDPNGRYHSTYDLCVPGLVVHGFDTLHQRAGELLDRTSRDEYDRYLERYVKGTIDPFVDGRGLTRFRDALCQAVVAKESPGNQTDGNCVGEAAEAILRVTASTDGASLKPAAEAQAGAPE